MVGLTYSLLKRQQHQFSTNYLLTQQFVTVTNFVDLTKNFSSVGFKDNCNKKAATIVYTSFIIKCCFQCRLYVMMDNLKIIQSIKQ